MTTHKQVEVDGINVDEGLADLLMLLWQRDIATQFSCQGGGPDPDIDAMIVFSSVEYAVAFMRGTFDVTGYWNCYTDRMTFTMANPHDLFGGPVRAIVRWPHDFTQVWTAAWRGTPLDLDDVLEIAEPGFKAMLKELEAEETS